MWFTWSDVEVMELARSWPSILAGYLRGWSTVGSFYVLCLAIVFAILPGQQLAGEPLIFGRSVLVPIAFAVALGGLVVSAMVYLLTRRPVSDDELARRAVFESFLGTAVDPALLDDPWSQRDDLERAMMEIAEQLGYGRAFDDWSAIALRPEMRVPEYLRLALTVSRLCQAAPEAGRDRSGMPQLHDAIWARLSELDPSVRAERPEGA